MYGVKMSLASDVFGAFGGIGGALIDNWNSNKRADKANDQSQANAKQNYEWQKEFAQNGLKWQANQFRGTRIK